jgi:hypothetical protein
MILYHFTSIVHLPRIKEAGFLKLTESNLHLTIPHYGPDVVWFTTEESARLGHGLFGHVDKTEIRFTVDLPDHWVKSWLSWAEGQGMDREWMGYIIEAGGGMEAAETWRVTFRPVRQDCWVSIDREGVLV